MAIRDDEDKAAGIGVTTPVYKSIAFMASAVLVGVAGAVYGYYVSFLDTSAMFDISLAIQVVLAALLGGRGTVWGPVHRRVPPAAADRGDELLARRPGRGRDPPDPVRRSAARGHDAAAARPAARGRAGRAADPAAGEPPAPPARVSRTPCCPPACARRGAPADGGGRGRRCCASPASRSASAA